MSPVRVLALAALLLSGGWLPAAPPAWVVEAARTPAGTFASDVPAVVLLDETSMKVEAGGRAQTTRRVALRILTNAGRRFATGALVYLDKRDRVETSAWVVRNGREIEVPADSRKWIDVAAVNDGVVFSEYRSRAISYENQVFAGDVFAYETVLEDRLLFAQVNHEWTGRLPVVVERFRLRPPSGWTLRAQVEGPGALREAGPDLERYVTWELRDQPYEPEERFMPHARNGATRLFVDFVPPAGRAEEWAGFPSWSDLAAWGDGLNAPQCDSSAALAATVQKLTADCADPLSRLRALSRYVQVLRYVAIDRGLGLGFGYRARKASEVHAKGWGDCKDKANLLRAMLREVGIESHLALAMVSGGEFVSEKWPSPHQFNHAILAIRIDDSIDLPATVVSPRLGRLLLFDPTHPHVLAGDLPWSLQGSRVFVLAPGNDELMTLPVLPTDPWHRLVRRVSLALGPDGSVEGEASLGGRGAAGARRRGLVANNSAKELREGATRLLSETVRGVSLQAVTPADDFATGECRLTFKFTAPSYLQEFRGGLSLVRLDVLSRDSVPTFTETKRVSPVVLAPIQQEDEVELRLPPGMAVDELPAGVRLESPYGFYESSFTQNGAVVVSRRILRLESRTVPVEEYAKLRQFLSDAAKADRAAVVLRRDG